GAARDRTLFWERRYVRKRSSDRLERRFGDRSGDPAMHAGGREFERCAGADLKRQALFNKLPAKAFALGAHRGWRIAFSPIEHEIAVFLAPLNNEAALAIRERAELHGVDGQLMQCQRQSFACAGTKAYLWAGD